MIIYNPNTNLLGSLYHTSTPYAIRCDELYHHGVKGMKWGVVRQKISATGRVIGSPLGRKNLPPSVTDREKYNERQKAKASAASQGQNVSKPKASTPEKVDNTLDKKPVETDHQKLKRLLGESGRDLTNDELQFVQNRLRMETEFKKLTAPKPGMKEWLADTLQAQAKKTVEWAVGEAMKGVVKKLVFEKAKIKPEEPKKKSS